MTSWDEEAGLGTKIVQNVSKQLKFASKQLMLFADCFVFLFSAPIYVCTYKLHLFVIGNVSID